MHKLVYLCDWLPPDFGAVGQYSLLFARQRAEAGEDVTLVGLSSKADSIEEEHPGKGRLRIVRVYSPTYDRADFVRRAAWTARTDAKLVWRTRKEIAACDELLFTGSPPFMLHLLAPLNVLLRKDLVYRITDFHPECLMAEMEKVPVSLKVFHRLTVAWRRSVSHFEVLGDDQASRLADLGIPADRVRLKRDPSPVDIAPETQPLPRPPELGDGVILLYSGNFGVAHDHTTFIEGYRKHHQEGSGRVRLWLNAMGAKADVVEKALRDAGLPVHRTKPVPLADLPRLLITPDAHLITLRDPFVGFVLPSKVYGCIQSQKPVLFVGSARSDVHGLCEKQLPAGAYHHVDVGDAAGVAKALEGIADRARVPIR